MTKIEICNMALSYVGSDTVSTLDVDSNNDPSKRKQIQQCNLHFNNVRDMILRRYRWKSTLKRVKLVMDTVTPEFEWRYQYHLPDDYLRILYTSQQSEPFTIEGRFLFANCKDLSIRYIKRVVNYGELDSYCIECIALMLASRMCVSLRGTDGPAVKQQLLEEFHNTVLPEAKASNVLESVEHDRLRINPGEWVESRAFGRPFDDLRLTSPL